MSAPSYPALYFWLCKLCCCYPPSLVLDRTRAAQRRLAGASLGCIHKNSSGPDLNLCKIIFTNFVLHVLNTPAICFDKKGFALFTRCLERRSQLKARERLRKRIPNLQAFLETRTRRSRRSSTMARLQVYKLLFPAHINVTAAFLPSYNSFELMQLDRRGAKYRKVLPHNLY